MIRKLSITILSLVLWLGTNSLQAQASREKIKINDGWKFMRYENNPDSLIYDERSRIDGYNDNVVADKQAELERHQVTSAQALKPWILPSANDFIKNPSARHKRPEGNPGKDFPFVKSTFDDSSWQSIDLPHDWAIRQAFYVGYPAEVGGGMGRLPSHGVAWYRKKINIPKEDVSRQIYLDLDGVMSYAIVWVNGNLVGGWPYGYNSFRLDLTPFINFGGENQISIRVDNPNFSSRWYPGGGIYRNVWLEKTSTVSVGQWGTFISAKNISGQSADLDMKIEIQNQSEKKQKVSVETNIYFLGSNYNTNGEKAAIFPRSEHDLEPGEKVGFSSYLNLENPKLWGPAPKQQPNLYRAITKIYQKGREIDRYETVFGIRNVKFDPVKGVSVNEEAIRIQGVNQHHDLGALGAAFNVRAAERQLEILKELGVNAIRLAHNPPAPELLDLTDRMGFLVINEIFDCWEKGKSPLDFHLIFPDWHEADIRSFVRRDRNHPSVIAWSFGNEVGEQYTAGEGAAVGKKLNDIVKEEDSTRPTTASMNFAKPDMPFPRIMDVISLNYQGEGIRDASAYQHLKGIRTSPLYPSFHEKFPEKLIVSSETASTLSTRGTYTFPVFEGNSAPVSDETGGNGKLGIVSDYGFYTAPFGASPDKVFTTQDQHPYVAGEFVWSGFDYLGEPTPYYTARSSYSGIVDLAGFKKDRFYQYQARWRPEFPVVHILPHWNWPDRTGLVTPVHVFTSGDEVELFLNGKSLGKKRKSKFEYRLRWDDVIYQPGELKAVAYKNGQKWAEEIISTTGSPSKIKLEADRDRIYADGEDLSFITVSVLDQNERMVPDASVKIRFSIEGSGEIVATDNGDPADMLSFASKERDTFSGLALVIVKFKKGKSETLKVIAESDGLQSGETSVYSVK